MNRIKLRITANGSVCGLWTDEVDFAALGRSKVRRASHVEFDDQRQRWTIREAVPRGRLRRWVAMLFGWPFGRVLYTAPTRLEALEWEREHFAPGGPGWKDIGTRSASALQRGVRLMKWTWRRRSEGAAGRIRSRRRRRPGAGRGKRFLQPPCG